MAYGFRRMTLADFPMAREWLATPEVQKWWVDPAGNVSLDEADLDEPGLRMWIVSFEGEPFAYIQDWDVHPSPDLYFTDRPEGARGIDQFIGVPAMIGKGHGTAFIRQHVAALFSEGVPEVVVDPDPANLRAIKAYQNAGFAPYGEHNSPEWGHVLLMSQKA